jgi:membrane fusion protein (multidrug efflux system)
VRWRRGPWALLRLTEVTVDQTTGMVTLRAEFPNPDRLLLPGMFARAQFVQGVKKDAVTVPQRAVTRMQGGKGSVLIVDEKDHAQMRMIETAEGIDGKWVVTEGLKAGERVVMEGHLKARPGEPVKPQPFVEKKPENGEAAPEGEKR